MEELKSTGRWSKLEKLFHSALELPETQRGEFLQRACPDDPQLQNEVQELLKRAAMTGEFLEDSPLPGVPEDVTHSLSPEGTPPNTNSARRSMIGQAIGHYKIVREIGAGGMGRVYLAVRSDDFQKSAAIKLLRAGVDSDTLIERFRIERQILAAFEHPHIARLLDGGATEDGLPYLVMEYIEGQPINEYCDQRKLSIEERLRLFLPVCAAVQYAHKNLVVHRDLKPSNILVTKEGAPKLLDFGIAKMLQPKLASATPLTQADVNPMTPEYASPEQILGSQITTSTDVYSLGAVLYELLTGHRLYQFKSRTLNEMVEIARNSEPVKPSVVVKDSDAPVRNANPQKLRRLLSGDLDNILLRALQKESQQRYNSVEQFADDIQRYLNGFPVMARKETFYYRAGKFVRRNKGQVAAGVLLLLTLSAGIVGTSWQARRAERRFQDVRKLAGSVVFELYDEVEKLPGSTHARELIVKRALEYLDSLAKEASGDSSLQLELASAYERVGLLQWDRFFGNLGDPAGALKSQRKAMQIRKAVADSGKTDEAAEKGLAASYQQLGDLEVENGDPKQALIEMQESLRIRQKLAAENPKDFDAHRTLARSYGRVGDVLGSPQIRSLGDVSGALENYKKMGEVMDEIDREHPGDTRALNGLAIVAQRLGYIKDLQGDLAGALEQHRKGLALMAELVRRQPQNIQAARNLADGYLQIGSVQVKQGDLAAAIESFGQAVSQGERLGALDPQNFGAHRDLLVWLNSLASTAFQAGRVADARQYASRRLLLEKSWAERPNAAAADWSQYASDLLTCSVPDLRQPELALRIAKRAEAMNASRDPGILDTLALAYFANGNRAMAVTTETAAIAAAGSRIELRKGYEAALHKYQGAFP